MSRLFHFLQYHNAVPIALGIVVLGAGGVFAATNPEAIYSAEQTVLSVDNTYLANKELSNWTPTVRITEVTEDTENYYVAYDFTTIGLEDYVWKDVTKKETMTVSKPDLGPYRDLGLYVMAQLKQVVDREIAFLKEVQEIEKRSVSQKMVATAYSGLVGALLNDTTEVVPGYVPVVTPPEPPPPLTPAGIVAGVSAENTAQPSAPSGFDAGVVLSGDPSDTEPPYVQILGSNPVMLQEGDNYIDLGVVAADHGDHDAVELTIYLNGEKKERIYFAEAPVGEWKVTYEAKDKAGNIRREVRIIKVVAKQQSAENSQSEESASPPPVPSPEPTPPPSPEATEGQSEPTLEPTPTPSPEPDSTGSTSSPQTSSPQATPSPEPASTSSTSSGQASSPQATPPPAPTPEPPPETPQI